MYVLYGMVDLKRVLKSMSETIRVAVICETQYYLIAALRAAVDMSLKGIHLNRVELQHEIQR